MKSLFQGGASLAATTLAREIATKSRMRLTTSTPGATAGSANRAASGRGPKGAGTRVRSPVTQTTVNRADRKVIYFGNVASEDLNSSN